MRLQARTGSMQSFTLDRATAGRPTGCFSLTGASGSTAFFGRPRGLGGSVGFCAPIGLPRLRVGSVTIMGVYVPAVTVINSQ